MIIENELKITGLDIMEIIEHFCHMDAKKENTYIIMGRTGPTGKTWLCNTLKKFGFKAFDLSGYVNYSIEYYGNFNYILRDCYDKITIIVLNKPLREVK